MVRRMNREGRNERERERVGFHATQKREASFLSFFLFLIFVGQKTKERERKKKKTHVVCLSVCHFRSRCVKISLLLLNSCCSCSLLVFMRACVCQYQRHFVVNSRQSGIGQNELLAWQAGVICVDSGHPVESFNQLLFKVRLAVDTAKPTTVYSVQMLITTN